MRLGLRAPRGAAVLVCVLATVPAGVGAATIGAKTIGSGVRLKGTNVWYVHGTALKPNALSARVVPVPSQPVKVQWSVVCQKPNPHDPADHLGARESAGQSSVAVAGTVRLRLPFARPPSCVATVYATLAKRGGLSLRLDQA